jgi:hypothetical protein
VLLIRIKPFFLEWIIAQQILIFECAVLIGAPSIQGISFNKDLDQTKISSIMK